MSEQEDPESRQLAALALGVEPVRPPAGLRAQILAAATAPVVVEHPRWSATARVPLGAVAAMVVVALLGGLLLGRVTAPSPPPEVTHFSLTGHGAMQGASASVTDLKQDGIALVSFSGLPPVPSGKLYEVWLITPDHRADPAGIFVPDENGQRLLVIERPLKGYQLLAVTVEVAPSGVAQPTQTPQLVGAVA